MRRRSAGQSSASAGISTDGLTIPHAIGIVARALRWNESRGDTPTSSASSRASGSHGASTTRSVRRDIHCTARTPMTRRARIARHPIAQIPIATAGQDTPRRNVAGWTPPTVVWTTGTAGSCADCTAAGRD